MSGGREAGGDHRMSHFAGPRPGQGAIASGPGAGVPRIDASFQEAIALQRQGRLAEAEAAYRHILQWDPTHAGALHLSGMLAFMQGDARRARDLIGRSIDSNPTRAEPHADLGSALHALGLVTDALESYERALALKPGLIAAIYNRGTALQDLNRLPEALESYDRVIALQPHLPKVHYNRALVLVALKRPEEALTSYDRALKVDPNYIEALNNRGIVLLELKRPEEALANFERVLQLEPGTTQTLNNRGNALRSLNRREEALASFDRALELDPTFFEAHRNRGGVLRELNRPEDALASFDAALHLRPDSPETLGDRAETLLDLKRYAEADKCLRRLLEVAPDIEYASGQLMHLQHLGCNWIHYAENERALVESTLAGRRAGYPFPFLAVSDSAQAQGQCARTFILNKYPESEAPIWRGERYQHKKIRVAYVSGDLRAHPVSVLMAGVFEEHDRERFETLAISLRPEEHTPLGERVRAAFDRFIDVSQKSDRETAALIRELEVDIAVDLMGFTQGSRTAVFARRPAPVQVNYLGYPGSLGASYIDYILADEFVIPAQHRQHYSESVVYLPECFQANDGRRASSETALTRRNFSLPEASLVFCCFNNSFKFNPACFDIWMRLLNAVPDSILWLLAETSEASANLRGAAFARGVNPERLVFGGRLGYSEHLARLQCADLFLDTWPFNGGTTASDALWAGVPLLTCAGEAFASRIAGSLLTAMQLPELITHSPQEYEALALKVATTPELLAGLRDKLARNRTTTPVFDTQRFCRHLESAYVGMWERSERGEAPESFAVPPLPL
jgi:protein O-GlcNAc transferase